MSDRSEAVIVIASISACEIRLSIRNGNKNNEKLLHVSNMGN